MVDKFIAICTFSNGDKTGSAFKNGVTREEIAKYYMNNWFNLGVDTDDMQKCIKVEFKDWDGE